MADYERDDFLKLYVTFHEHADAPPSPDHSDDCSDFSPAPEFAAVAYELWPSCASEGWRAPLSAARGGALADHSRDAPVEMGRSRWDVDSLLADPRQESAVPAQRARAAHPQDNVLVTSVDPARADAPPPHADKCIIWECAAHSRRFLMGSGTQAQEFARRKSTRRRTERIGADALKLAQKLVGACGRAARPQASASIFRRRLLGAVSKKLRLPPAVLDRIKRRLAAPPSP
jgi:hypothetical protein